MDVNLQITTIWPDGVEDDDLLILKCFLFCSYRF